MLRVLLIDDELQSVETLIEELKGEIEGIIPETKGFDDANTALLDFVPDVVILDIFRGGATPDGDTAGLDPCKFIWGTCFCPLVVYSAQPDIVSDQIPEHPFVRLVQKGSGSEAKVISYIKEFIPHVEALNKVQNDIRQHVNRELKNVAPLVFNKITNVDKRKAVFVRAARRRIAAMMDEPLGEEIASWEQYLYPPVGVVLLTGDIIRKSKGEEQDPESYYIILTPSCDMAFDDRGKTKVDKVLVACCTNVEKMLPEVKADETTGIEKLREKLLPFLRRGYGSYCIPLPEFPGVFPAMVAQLKNLKLIELSKIGNDKRLEYYRVTSVDSPFREMITWAYIQITGRPGLPERDFDAWADEICSLMAEKKKKGSE